MEFKKNVLEEEEVLYRQLRATEARLKDSSAGTGHPVTDYSGLVRECAWRQKWNGGNRKLEALHEVTGRVWSDAIERCLAEHGSAYLPRLDAPVYLDRPIVLRSGNRLVVHPETEIRLIAGESGTCLIRNEHAVASQLHPVAPDLAIDRDIKIEGGIWSDQLAEGRGRGGFFDRENSMIGAHGIFLLINLSGLVIRNVTFRDCSPYAVQLGNADDFLIEHIVFDETADGIHLNGPSERGIIRGIRGKTNDDIVALNAWEWDDCGMAFGAISDILVEDVEPPPGYTWAEIRLLPGVKHFPGGETVDCSISRCIFRDIRSIHTFKMYDQPNLARPEKDFSDPIGRMSGLFFAGIGVDGIRQADYYDKSSDAVFDICADVDGISIRDVRFNYTPGVGDMPPYLVAVGPKALTWPRSENPQDGWKEVFNPNADPVVSGLTVQDVRVPDPQHPGAWIPAPDPAALIHARTLSINADFPHTMPRGGTGRGRIVDPAAAPQNPIDVPRSE